jgi:ABC-type glycerol-3-phosphate transport system substrate-binding protein
MDKSFFSSRALKLLRLTVLLPLILTGCADLFPASETPFPQDLPTHTPVSTEVIHPTTEVSLTPTSAITLRLWVPPQFDPSSGTPAGDLLQARLDAFSEGQPGVRVEVRIKAVDGPGGLLDSLTTTSAAAKLAIPDLIALPHTTLETAALKGLIFPYDGLSTAMDDPDWYDYARQLAQIQDSTYGLPFAGDAFVLAYRPGVVPVPPPDWTSVLTSTVPMVFPAADPLALFTLTLYQANGGPIHDDQGRPLLDAGVLSEVLTFYHEAEQIGVMPYWLTQYETDDQVWETFQEKLADLAVISASRHLGSLIADTNIAQIPTPDGTPYTLASGWVWATPAIEPARQELSIQLAEFLTESSFMATWTEAIGYLPTRPSSLASWSNTSLQSLVELFVLSSRIIPSSDVLMILGPPLEQATVEVIKGQNDPVTAAQNALEALTGP